MINLAPQYTQREFYWTAWKAALTLKKFSPQFESREGIYYIWGYDGPEVLICRIWIAAVPDEVIIAGYSQDQNDTDKADFEANVLPNVNSQILMDVATRSEKDDKNLKTVQANAVTDSSGVAVISFHIPSDGRWLAQGDVEFHIRHFWDRVTQIYVEDTDRLIRQMIGASTDQEVIDAGAAIPGGPFPNYPSLGSFHDEDYGIGAPIYSGGPPAYCPGMTMTFQYGETIAEPVGGYAWIDGGFYLIVKVQKGEDCPADQKEGQWVKSSIDWAKKK